MDRRKKQKLKYLWNGSVFVKVVLVLIPVVAVGLISWGSWATLSIAKVPETYTTKMDCETAQKKDQEARNRLEKRMCDRITKNENHYEQMQEDQKEMYEKFHEEQKEMLTILGDIKGMVKRDRDK